MLRKLLSLLLILGITLVLVELVLQVVAFAVSKNTREDSGDATGNAKTILCVGDSFTYGQGATQPGNSYPAQLEKILTDRDGAGTWRVINAGHPGRNSAEIIEEIERRFSEQTPDYLCVVGGCNDFWSYPEATSFSGDAEAEGFKFEIRLLKFFHIMRGGDVFGQEAMEGGTAVGHENGAGEAPVKPELPPVEFVSSPSTPEAMNHLGAGWDKLNADDYVGAEKEFRQMVDYEEALGWSSLIRLYRETGDGAKMKEALRRLSAIYERDPSLENAEHFMSGLHAFGDWDQAIAAHGALREAHPDSFSIHFFASDSEYQGGDHGLAREISNRALELMDVKVPPSTRSWFLRTRAWLMALDKADPLEAERCLLEAYRMDGDDDATRETYLLCAEGIDDDTLGTIQNDYPVSDPINAYIYGIRSTVMVPRDEQEARDVLAGHLKAIAAECERHDVTCVLGTYPFTAARLDETMIGVAEEIDVPLMRVERRIIDELKDTPWDTLFLPDKHCTDRGYAIMAEVMAEAFAEEEVTGR